MQNFNFKKGDIIIFCDEEFEVIEAYTNSGKVRPIGEDYCIYPFYWKYGDSICRLKADIK